MSAKDFQAELIKILQDRVRFSVRNVKINQGECPDYVLLKFISEYNVYFFTFSDGTENVSTAPFIDFTVEKSIEALITTEKISVKGEIFEFEFEFVPE